MEDHAPAVDIATRASGDAVDGHVNFAPTKETTPWRSRKPGTENLLNMSHTDCDHQKVRIADPLGDPETSRLVDAGIAPLIVQMSDSRAFFCLRGRG